MIIDTSSYPVSPDRRFFGLKKNGRFFFKESNKETGYYLLSMDHSKGRIEGESSFIKLTSSNTIFNGRELILGISKRGTLNDAGYYVELYDLNNKNKTKIQTSNIFGNIASDSFSIIETPNNSDSKFYYTITYLVSNSDTDYWINIKKSYFSFDNNPIYNHVKEKSFKVGVQTIVSCFYTEKPIYICFYLSDSNALEINAFEPDFSSSNKTTIYSPSSTYEERRFNKGIHLKGEIGFFIYFKENVNSPTISILQCNNGDKKMITYSNPNFREININKYTFNIDTILNDIIKLNEYQVCYISINDSKSKFYFVTFTLYKDDQLMNIRYYELRCGMNIQ